MTSQSTACGKGLEPSWPSLSNTEEAGPGPACPGLRMGAKPLLPHVSIWAHKTALVLPSGDISEAAFYHIK